MSRTNTQMALLNKHRHRQTCRPATAMRIPDHRLERRDFVVRHHQMGKFSRARQMWHLGKAFLK
ncbi:MAG: hypothetical protein QGH33_15705, partial [Pirellulaceae bacterium]|nr:hypothetical protein [Pirellulaceae bacterium]